MSYEKTASGDIERHYLGQMDVNAKSPKVWEFYEDVLSKLANYGCQVVSLDAFAYLHKEVEETNFFNKPKAGADGHKEINRTTLSLDDIKAALKKDVVSKQLDIIRLRNTSTAFLGTVEFKETTNEDINILWTNGDEYAQLEGNLKTHLFSIRYSELGEEKKKIKTIFAPHNLKK